LNHSFPPKKFEYFSDFLECYWREEILAFEDFPSKLCQVHPDFLERVCDGKISEAMDTFWKNLECLGGGRVFQKNFPISRFSVDNADEEKNEKLLNAFEFLSNADVTGQMVFRHHTRRGSELSFKNS